MTRVLLSPTFRCDAAAVLLSMFVFSPLDSFFVWIYKTAFSVWFLFNYHNNASVSESSANLVNGKTV